MPKYIATAETIATQTESVRRQAERNAARARGIATPKAEDKQPVVYASDIPVGELTDDQKAELTGKRGGKVLAYFRKDRVPRGLRQWYVNRLALGRAVN